MSDNSTVKRKKIAVITARADDAEQRSVLLGVAKAAFALGADVNVFTNIYNFWADDNLMTFENVIYDFFNPFDYDGVIITPEPFKNQSIPAEIINKIRASKVPTVSIDHELPGAESIFYDDKTDIEQVAGHLISVHKFTNIDMITGPKDSPTSLRRVNGYISALEKNGIPYDERKVHFSNFWIDGGEEIARKYISKELKLPQAIICANDFMAYGLCKELINSGIKIPEDITVMGYDYSEERIYNYPLLTTYRKGRYELGVKAVNMLLYGNYPESHQKKFFSGNTCPCGADSEQLRKETNDINVAQIKTAMSQASRFGNRLTLCHTLGEYFKTLSEYLYLVFDANSMTVCLDKDWNSSRLAGKEYLICKMNKNGADISSKTVQRKELIRTTEETLSAPHISYYLPFVFQMKAFGVAVVEYDYPHCYDMSLRNFIDTAENTLEILGMKNDIIYLNQCYSKSTLDRTLADFMTFEELNTQIKANLSAGNKNILAIKLRFSDATDVLPDEFERAKIISATASAIRKIASNQELCCYDDNSFLILCPNECFADKIKSVIHCEIYGKFSSSVLIDFSESNEQISVDSVQALLSELEKKSLCSEEALRSVKKMPHYDELWQIRDEFICSPEKYVNIDQASRRLCISEGHLRRIYKEYFGVTYVNDGIFARISYAKYLLSTTPMSVYSIAMKCGYSDEKYFMRQFKQLVGCSPVQYRRS